MVGFGFLGSGREAYALRADWRHDGRASERASERNAWRQSADGAFMVDVVGVKDGGAVYVNLILRCHVIELS